ncbi:hypothetical protein ACT8ZV_22995 [Nocardioides sp. MAHUQ-72]|uniref:hypothetical protein n=1 Tax=unclassified Nocardioides TaxID=2615069 RepID=UPI00361F59BF
MSASTPLRVAGFLAGLVAVFALALGLGRLVGPLDVADADDGHDMTGTTAGHDMDTSGTTPVGALQSAEDGYVLTLADPTLAPGRQRLAFTISGPDGAPVTAYDVVHEKRLHLVVVRRDLTGFQHVHPRLDPGSGRWSTDVRLTPGVWRVVADFTPAGGEPLTLGQDLSVPGGFAPAPLGPERRVATVDGYEVRLAGDLTAGAEARLALTVARAGEPVTDLQPYLGAYGHLVALRAGDLGYLHVHPDGEPGEVPAGPEVVFHADVPSAGSYRLFLDFRHEGVVRTAAFTVHVGDEALGSHETPGEADHGH